MNKLVPFGLLYVTACGRDNETDKQENTAPTITITSHGDGAEMQEGFVESFRAVVSDDDNEFNELSVAWYVDDDMVCDWEVVTMEGESSCEMVFELGDGFVAAEVKDPTDERTRTEIAISVLPTEAPIVELLTPIAGDNYYSDVPIHFSALVSDAEDDAEDLVILWTSDVDGELSLDNSFNASGEISDYANLTEGSHAIELRVEDTTGNVSTDEVVIEVGGENSIPVCGFTTPDDETGFAIGDAILLSGVATDDDIANTDLTVELSSDLDGALQSLNPDIEGTFSFETTALSSGTHTVTLIASDEVGAECTSSLVVSVGTPPTTTIDEPLDGAVITVGESVTFLGTVSDVEDASDQLAVVWASDLDGELQSGNANSQGMSEVIYSDLSAGVHTISFTATDTIGLVTEDTVGIRVNTLPVVDSITLSPDPVYGDDNLVVTTTGSDADGQNVTMTHAWYEDGTLTSFTGTTIDSVEMDVGETWTVRVTPNDGFQDGNYVEQSITISNTDPTITSATISPSSNLNASSLLTCSATGNDADDGSLTPTYTWAASGGATNTGATWQLDPSLISGTETITCTASVTDVNGATASSTSSSVTVTNTPPTSTGISISPSTGVVTGSILSCSAGFNDLEDGSLTPTYDWTVGGNSISGTTTYTVNNIDTNVGDSVLCTASVTDSDGNTVTDSATVTVDNTNPIISNVSVSPNIAVTNDATLTCSASASDIDETVSPTFAWNQNGTPFANGATVDLSQHSISPNDTIECVASVADSNDGSASGTDSVGIGNRAPVVTVPTISNTSPEADETITCSATVTDADGGTPTVTYEWSNGQSTLGNSATLTLSPSTVNVGDPIVCTVTATDSYGMTGGSSSLATVINTDPTISASTISPTTANVNDLLTCSATGNDLNDGTLTPTYAWSASGGATSSGPTWQLDSNTVSGAETITCTATVTDNDQATATSNVNITLDNSMPTVDSISITPNTSVVTGTSLTCAATISDIEDGSLTPTYAWTVNGSIVSNSATYTVNANDTNVSDSVECSASVTDSDGNTVTDTTSVTVDNTTPIINNVLITSSDNSNFNSSVYTCSESVTDIDDNISTTYTWSVGGTGIGNGTNILDAATEALLPGDEVMCTVEVIDGDTGVTITQSESVTIVSTCGQDVCQTTLDLGGGQTIDMVLIPSGTFTMGSPEHEEGRWASGEEQYSVTFTNDIFVMTTEVTQGMFYQLMGYEAYDGQNTSSTLGSYGVGNDYPAYYVSWDMAADFANTLTQQQNIANGTSLEECYSCSGTGTNVVCSVAVNPYQCSGYRLLTEAEWEYAARAGTTTAFWTPNGGGDLPSGYTTSTYSLTDGFDLTLYAWFRVNNSVQNGFTYGSKEVAQLMPNDHGLYDMTGNIREWTQDWYGTYPTGDATNPTGVTSGARRVLRGGDWRSSASFIRSARRDTSSGRNKYNGFRLTQTQPVEPTTATIAISNQSPDEQEDLYCEILIDSVDYDGNSITYTFEWTVDGSIYNGSTGSTMYLGDTIPASETNGGEEWECRVTPNDGTEDGETSIDSVSIVSACGHTICDVTIDLGGGQSIDMVLIPSGSFTMGSPSDEVGRNTDEDQFNVTLTNDYYVMTTEVTQGMFYQLMGYEAYDGYPTSNSAGSFGVGNDYAAYFVSWHMAADFANTLTLQQNLVNGTSLQECYSCSGTGTNVVCSVAVNPYQCSGYRLLTEAEWEYAARAGTTTAFWTPNGGGDLPSGYTTSTSSLTDGYELILYAHYYPTYANPYGVKEVGLLAPNDYGLHDMSGNVYEWINDEYDLYLSGSVIDPTGGSGSSDYVQRGGYWIGYPDLLRTAHRNSARVHSRNRTGGFRLALGQTTQPSAASIAIANQAPTEQVDDLYCEVLVDSIDPDGNSVTYTLDWTVDGSTYNGTPTTTAYSGDTIPASDTNAGEVWECTVTPNDGTEDGVVSTDSVTIATSSTCGLTSCDINLDLGGGQSIDMVLIPADTEPLGRYELTIDFYLMTTEVTQGMFTELMSYDPTTYSTTYGVGNNYPAYYVNWHMAADFANMVTQHHNTVNGTTLQECYVCSSSDTTSVTCTEAMNPYQCSGYVLPTDAEWGYAARSGTQYDFWTPDGGGNYSVSTCNGTETIQDGMSNPLLRDYAWYCGNRNNQYGGEGSKEVGQKLPNGFGLYDMHGNMWEWTADWWGCSFPQTITDPFCSTPGSLRVGRDGTWASYPLYMRASARDYGSPTYRSGGIGFRIGLHP